MDSRLSYMASTLPLSSKHPASRVPGMSISSSVAIAQEKSAAAFTPAEQGALTTGDGECLADGGKVK